MKMWCDRLFSCFFFNDTATTEIYTLSLHDALPIFGDLNRKGILQNFKNGSMPDDTSAIIRINPDGSPAQGNPFLNVSRRSEEHTSELQSRQYLVCRLLLEKNNNNRFWWSCKFCRLA